MDFFKFSNYFIRNKIIDGGISVYLIYTILDMEEIEKEKIEKIKRDI